MRKITSRNRFEDLCKEEVFGTLSEIEVKLRDKVKGSVLLVSDEAIHLLSEEIRRHPVRDRTGQDLEAVLGPIDELKIGCLTINKQSSFCDSILAILDSKIAQIEKEKSVNAISSQTAEKCFVELRSIKLKVRNLIDRIGDPDAVESYR